MITTIILSTILGSSIISTSILATSSMVNTLRILKMGYKIRNSKIESYYEDIQELNMSFLKKTFIPIVNIIDAINMHNKVSKRVKNNDIPRDIYELMTEEELKRYLELNIFQKIECAFKTSLYIKYANSLIEAHEEKLEEENVQVLDGKFNLLETIRLSNINHYSYIFGYFDGELTAIIGLEEKKTTNEFLKQHNYTKIDNIQYSQFLFKVCFVAPVNKEKLSTTLEKIDLERSSKFEEEKPVIPRQEGLAKETQKVKVLEKTDIL